MIGRRTEIVLNRSVRFAIEQEHEYFTLEHVIWSLLEEKEIQEVVSACGADPKNLRQALDDYIKKEIPHAVRSDGRAEHPVATLSVQRLIQRALFQVQSSGKNEIIPQDLFAALFFAKDSYGLSLIQKAGIERLRVLNFISHGQKKNTDPSLKTDEILSAFEKDASSDPLTAYAINLNDRALKGRIDPLVGRQNELDRMLQILCRRKKNNPLLIGEAGVGKTALAEGLATRIVEGAVPPLLSSCVIYSLDLGSLLAGAKFRGDFEQRFKRVLESLSSTAQKKGNGEPILFIDEIHNLIGAGAVSGGSLDAANLLKPMLASGEIRCIGSTTYQEYRNIFEKDHALARRFQKIEVLEPSLDEAVKILNGIKSHFEKHHQVQYTQAALRAAVELSQAHIKDRSLPDKAIDVMDEAGAKTKIFRANQRNSNQDGSQDLPTVIDAAEIEEIIVQITRIPSKSVSLSHKEKLRNLERDLKLALFGQDHAVAQLATAIRLSRSGLRAPDKPMGSFLLCGPTGVGKTELSKQLSHCLSIPLLRFDMSEYNEKHMLSRLIGAPPGYVGYEQAGLLTEGVLKNPYCVLLLDEIEKSHSDIWNLLLQVMDHGILTDNNGRKADFKNVILLMTSNVGSRDLEKRTLGFDHADYSHGRSQKAVEQTFSPEFRNRLDGILHFNRLDPLTIGQIVGKHLIELESQLLSKGVEIDVSVEVREWLAEKGFDISMGARPLSRVIEEYLKKPLAEEILFGRLEQGGRVKVFLKEGHLEFDYEDRAEPNGPGIAFEASSFISTQVLSRKVPTGF